MVETEKTEGIQEGIQEQVGSNEEKQEDSEEKQEEKPSLEEDTKTEENIEETKEKTEEKTDSPERDKESKVKASEEKSLDLEDTKTEETKTVINETEKTKRKTSDKDNIIYVGIKPFMNYVTGVVMQFQNKGQDEVIVSARGKFISKAVDIVEVARRTFLKDEDIKVESINISSEPFESKEGRRIFVSSIEIRLLKG